MNDNIVLAPDGYAQRIHSCMNKMSAKEKIVADFVIDRPLQDIDALTINDFAEQTGVSTSTVIRFCRTIGFHGFSEFKFYLQKLPQSASDDAALLNTEPNAPAIKNKVVALTNSAVASTVMVMDNQQLEAAVKLISKCKSVIFWGQGTASGVAQAAAASFVNMGIHAIPYTDTLTAVRSVMFLKEDDVVVVINRNGKFGPGLKLFDTAKKCGVKTIAITEQFDSPLAKNADVVLCTALNDRSLPIMLPIITMCQHLTIQLLQVGVLLQNYTQLRERIDEMYGVIEPN